MPRAATLYELLEASARLSPDSTSLISGTEQITYKSLNEFADRICVLLQAAGVTNGDRVAIYTNKSIGSVAAIFGILKSGAAYIPIDYTAPIERNNYIAENAEVKAIIIHRDFVSSFTNNFTLSEEIDDSLTLLINKRTDLKKSNEDLAYILYTSGSTGHPKGVMYSHPAALEFINWSSETFKPESSDRFSSHAPFHFDLSVFDLFVCIKHQASLVLIDEQTAKQPLLLASLISEKKISIWYSTPTVLNLLATFGKMNKYNYESLRLVLFAGEVFPIIQFTGLKKFWPTVTYYNLYGPTETNVCTFYKIPEDLRYLKHFPIGKCCPHYNGSVLPTGELCISGKGIMEGYWQSELQTTNAFFTDEEGVRWYKTLDLVESDKDQNYVYKGRIDRMVKRNGYRIELGEIEFMLQSNPAIIECAVIAHTNEDAAVMITAFVCCVSKEDESFIKMKEFSNKHLPAYMIPNNFVFLSTLPQTSSNKVSYQQLKELL